MLFLPAYAKLNLGLVVVGRRADGRHDLLSAVVHLDWHDLVGVGVREAPAFHCSLEMRGECEGLPTGDANLAVRAARGLAAASGLAADVRLLVDKRLPAAAGLGGGSADAAAVLRAIGILRPSTRGALEGVAAATGSDVPATLRGGGLLLEGAGERLSPLTHPPLHLAVALAGHSSTAATFSALEETEWGEAARIEELAAVLARGLVPDPGVCGSSLEGAACRANPALAAGLERLRRGVPEAAWALTGSGGAAFAIAPDAASAAALAARARAAGLPARSCRTTAPF